jgi:dynein heavy chain, axonemal
VNIHDLEMNLQSFINRSFENISSTEQALNLLKQIQQIMQRDSLKADLEAKYMIIFQHYGLDMDSIQKTYEKNKVLQFHILSLTAQLSYQLLCTV